MFKKIALALLISTPALAVDGTNPEEIVAEAAVCTGMNRFFAEVQGNMNRSRVNKGQTLSEEDIDNFMAFYERMIKSADIARTYGISSSVDASIFSSVETVTFEMMNAKTFTTEQVKSQELMCLDFINVYWEDNMKIRGT